MFSKTIPKQFSQTWPDAQVYTNIVHESKLLTTNLFTRLEQTSHNHYPVIQEHCDSSLYLILQPYLWSPQENYDQVYTYDIWFTTLGMLGMNPLIWGEEQWDWKLKLKWKVKNIE